jgi:hypothetical protein
MQMENHSLRNKIHCTELYHALKIQNKLRGFESTGGVAATAADEACVNICW